MALSLSTLELNPMRMTTWTKLTATLMSVLVIATTALAAEASMDHLVISVNPKILRPTTQPNLFGALTLTAIDAHGAEQSVPISEAAITVKTKVASGGVTVAVLKNGKIIPKEGGVATVEAVVRRDGREFKASTDVVVSPFYRDYHQALVLKLFLGMEGEPVERLANDPTFRKGHEVFCTFEEALEVIRKTDNLTRGIPKIIYLVGWQKGGHDHGYPAWSEVNPRLKRPHDATALASLRWLIREGRKHNTTVSLHLNMVDAYRHSPLWDEYVAHDCFAKDESGNLLVAGIQVKGDDMYNVVYPKEWAAGLAQRRIDALIKMIPELKAGHTIHIDVFIANRDGGKPLSPWHAKPENGGLTPEKIRRDAAADFPLLAGPRVRCHGRGNGLGTSARRALCWIAADVVVVLMEPHGGSGKLGCAGSHGP